MVRSFLFALVFLILAAAQSLTVEYFIVDAVTDGIIRLEPFAGDRELPSDEQRCLYTMCGGRQSLAEGQVVICLTAGGRILAAVPDPAKTESRRTEIEAVIRRIGSTDPGNG